MQTIIKSVPSGLLVGLQQQLKVCSFISIRCIHLLTLAAMNHLNAKCSLLQRRLWADPPDQFLESFSGLGLKHSSPAPQKHTFTAQRHRPTNVPEYAAVTPT